MRLLIVGGYGTFGGRIVELLESDSRLTLVVSGRSLSSAKTLCASRGATAATLEPARFDRQGALAAQISALRPDVIVDASGPFQSYDKDAYALVTACIAARVDYLDLADGAAFVAGVSVYDDAARAAGVYVLSGVSSFPVLTAAVVRRIAQGMLRLDAIEGGIAPSPYAGVGANVVRAIASYAGQPAAYLGRTSKIIGRPFTQQRRVTISPPGRLPLRSTMFSLVDVPDLRVLSARWPGVRRVWMGAGPAPELLHRALIFCAWLVSFGIVRTLQPFAPVMHWFTNHVRWGEHRGGMYVTVKGADASGVPTDRAWHLLAEGADGPLIPSMAVQAIVLKHLAGALPAPGARACVDDVELEDYERLFAARTIYTGVRDSPAPNARLYQRLLGGAWERLPPSVRAMHDHAPSAEGEASVERGANPLAWLAARLMSFPPAAPAIPLQVRFDVRNRGETWRRTFGDHSFSSRQYEGRGKSERLLVERFGVVEFAMALVLEDGRMRLVPRRWSVLGIHLPLWLAPRSDAYETEENGVFRFHVDITHPLAGRIVRYRGWLKPTTDPSGQATGT